MFQSCFYYVGGCGEAQRLSFEGGQGLLNDHPMEDLSRGSMGFSGLRSVLVGGIGAEEKLIVFTNENVNGVFHC